MGDRTEEPTGRKLSEARDRGNVAKSQDLAAAVEFIGAAVVLVFLGAWASRTINAGMRRALEGLSDGGGFDAGDVMALVRDLALTSGLLLGVLCSLVAVVAALAYFVQIGWLFTSHPLKPDLNRINPVKGLQRLLGPRSLAKTGVNVVKLCAVLGVGWLYISSRLADAAALPALHMQAALALVGRMVLELAAILLALMLVVGVIDYMYQRFQHTKDLRMTKQEVKDERRSMDGDPLVKGKRLRMAREIVTQRLGQSVPDADVVVTNPTHFSVALKYDADGAGAPRVVAKGADLMALRIRQIAALHAVPIVERPPLARALYWGVDVGREIPPEYYQAVAEILAYVYRLESKAA